MVRNNGKDYQHKKTWKQVGDEKKDNNEQMKTKSNKEGAENNVNKNRQYYANRKIKKEGVEKNY